ncbi:cupin domain-containing protein [Muriicola sp. Z0-33]|uniref:cupin domain-containing protein n=1 Tax=Muriicola sp. Z0-33 TaxID=2816957 RepID=UPI0022386A14|nr:cupin domain-containing protein [Muriicola sp. Z0-33]MCW5517178.1 cupin domain-containing protein [Muriicola sp. Z0-33]
MYELNNIIASLAFNGLQVKQLIKTSFLEILCISLENGAIFPEHTSPRDAELIVLEGEITFFINEQQFDLHKYQHFRFPKEVRHWVQATENSKFLIIR